MRAVDTNVLVGLMARDDAKQTSAAEQFIAEGAWVSLLVLAETVWVLESVYQLRKQQIATAVSMLLEHKELVLQQPDTIRNALEAFRASRGVGFTDCLVVAIAKSAGHQPVCTFDRKLSRLPDALRL